MSEKPIRIRKGLDIRLAGSPALFLESAMEVPEIAVTPAEFPGIKPRLLVKEGDYVRRGTPILEDKSRPGLRIASPAAGTVRTIVFGPRRSIERVVIAPAVRDEAEPLERFAATALPSAPRERVMEALLRSGYLALLRQRPFSRVPDPAATPRAIFVNGMNTAPFQADIHFVIRGQETAFQAGLDALTRLTPGKVYLCLDADARLPSPAVTGAQRVVVRYFRGPHPAGNTSVHIHHLDPIRRGDVVWTARAVDVIRIGRLLLEGAVPPDQIVALGGPGVRLDERRYYRVRTGAPLSSWLKGRLYVGEQRLIAGDALGGEALPADGHVRLGMSALTVLPEDRERHFMGWAMPGLNAFSHSNLFLSRLLRPLRRWDHGTNRHGSERAMVVTGLYERYLPMRILPDFLVRAVLARDTEEAIRLGLLEVDPEDFALCAFVCPSKMDLCGIIRAGLAEVESEGL